MGASSALRFLQLFMLLQLVYRHASAFRNDVPRVLDRCSLYCRSARSFRQHLAFYMKNERYATQYRDACLDGRPFGTGPELTVTGCVAKCVVGALKDPFFFDTPQLETIKCLGQCPCPPDQPNNLMEALMVAQDQGRCTCCRLAGTAFDVGYAVRNRSNGRTGLYSYKCANVDGSEVDCTAECGVPAGSVQSLCVCCRDYVRPPGTFRPGICYYNRRFDCRRFCNN